MGLAELPGWAKTRWGKPLNGEGGNGQAPPRRTGGERIPAGKRHDALKSLGGAMRRQGATEEEILAAFLAMSEARFDPPESEDELRKQARDFAARYDPEPPDPLAGVTVQTGGRKAQTPRAREAVLVRTSTVTPRRVEWLWRNWLPLGMLSILDGDPGLGKSTATLDLAARVSTGRGMPLDETRGREPAGVLLLTAEDSLAHTVRPRLDLAGAEPSRVHVLSAVRYEAGDARPPVIPWDLELVGEFVRSECVRLVVVDPLVAFIAEEFDAHRDQEVRRCLHPVAEWAADLHLCVLFLRHLNKVSGAPALYRGGGSIGIVGACRTALVVGRDPDDPDVRVLAMNKTNVGDHPESLTYRMEPRPEGVRVKWLGGTKLGRDEILWHGTGKADALSTARRLLTDLLAAGPVLATQLREEVEAAGLSWATVRRAQEDLGIQPRKDGAKWYWELPQKEGAQDAQGREQDEHLPGDDDVTDEDTPF